MGGKETNYRNVINFTVKEEAEPRKKIRYTETYTDVRQEGQEIWITRIHSGRMYLKIQGYAL